LGLKVVGLLCQQNADVVALMEDGSAAESELRVDCGYQELDFSQAFGIGDFQVEEGLSPAFR
jgi:hypothetical protein